MNRAGARTVVALVALALLATAAAAQARTLRLDEYRLGAGEQEQLRERWLGQLEARYGTNTWAPMRFELGNRELRLMGLPSKRVLTSHRYRVPTKVYPDGRLVRLGHKSGHAGGGKPGGGPAAGPGLVTYAGAGFFGIRPGAWLLLISGNSVGWCSMAHVYGAPGSYEISTAGHCGKPGDIGTVIGVVGNRAPVLIDFGAFKTSQDAGLGKDWALISVRPEYQHLVTPTMAFWGGPIGMYTAQGEVVDPKLTGRNPGVAVNPDPTLVQQLVHYGHGLGVGAGGTPRSGSAIAWGATHFMFFGAISPGDSGSGANTLTGDTAGANREAAGIMTHLYIDPLMRQGLGIMGGTRATSVSGTLANGQILPYPAPVPAAP